MSPTRKLTTEPTPERRASDHWHIDKRIPVMLFVAVVGQTAGGIWWMSQMSSELRGATAALTEFKNERYTREDARRDRELVEQKLELARAASRELERRINLMENRVDRWATDASSPAARQR